MITKQRFQELAGILTEQLSSVASDLNVTPPIETIKSGLESDLSEQDSEEILKDYLAGYVSYVRALNLWFHAAHHMSKGTGFGGDHVNIYQRIYEFVQDEVDGAIEKAVGITNDENLACPIMMAKNAITIMEDAGCEVDASADEIAEAGLRLEKAYLSFISEMFKVLEKHDELTLGLNDQLAASANEHETFVYLLQQRTK